MSENFKTHVSEEKKRLVKNLAELMQKKTVMVVSIKGLPSAQFQDIKKKLRGKATIQVAKKSLIDFALEHAKNDTLHDLVKFVEADFAMLFSDQDAFEISGILASEKSVAKAKAGQEAPEDINISAGPTDLLPGPDISALSAVGLQPKVEDGKISIVNDAVLCKAGEIITPEKASILAKLDITPFRIGLEPIAAAMDGEVYADIKIDKEEFIEDMLNKYSRIVPFAVEIGYINNETLPFILGKAVAQENAISNLIKTEDSSDASAPEDVPSEGGKEKSEEEVKKEDGVTESTEEKSVEEEKEETVDDEKEDKDNTEEVNADKTATAESE